MKDLHEELREALHRRNPPDGFVDRVMARIPAKPKRQVWNRQWLAVAAAGCIAVVGSGVWEQHRRQVEGQKAKQELMYALTVASESLQTTKHVLTKE
jgi:hypothetical protein